MKIQTRSILLILVFICLAVAAPTRKAFGIVPAPDGCYPNYTTAEGCNALAFLTTGLGNTGVGWSALISNTDANYNTGIGGGALALNNADSNTAVGAGAMLLNTTGAANTAVGTDALVHNDSGSENTANGAFALFSNSDGSQNSALGDRALFSNDNGSQNTALGSDTLSFNTTGSENTAVGQAALQVNSDGTFNTAVGVLALGANASGLENTAIGRYALHLSTGIRNTALGHNAGGAQTTGSGNVYIGAGVIGFAGEDNHTYLRNINTTSVSGGNADSVTVDLMTGLLGHASSSQRYKEEIRPMDKASEIVYRLNPVTYRYKKEIDPTQSSAFGLIAEEVAKVNPELVAHNAKGQPETVHYEMINAMLLNEFLKEHRKVEDQEAAIVALKSELRMVRTEQQKEIQMLTARLEEQAAQIQSVQRLDTARRLQSAQMVMNNP